MSRWTVVLTLAVALLSPAWAATAVGARSDPKFVVPVHELSGTNRFQTAVAASTDTHDAADHVVLVPGGDAAHMIVGAGLAARLGSPLLLSDERALPVAVVDEIARLGASRATVVGPSGQIGQAVLDQLADAGVVADRLSGQDVFQTAALANQAAGVDGATTAYVAPVADPPADPLWREGMLAILLAAASDARLLLTESSTVPQATIADLAASGVDQVVLIGDPAVADPAVEGRLRARGRTVARLTAPTPSALSVLAAKQFQTGGGVTYVAGADAFVDGLIGAAIAGAQGADVLLTDRRDQQASEPVLTYLADDQPDRLVIIGGVSGIGERKRDHLRTAVGGVLRATKGPRPQPRSGGGDVILLAAGMLLGVQGLVRRVRRSRHGDQSSQGINGDQGGHDG